MKNKRVIHGDKTYYILDSTTIIHYIPNEEPISKNSIILLPEGLKQEIKSPQSRAALELIEADNQVVYTHASQESLKKIKLLARNSGDSSTLSNVDIHVLALSLDYPDSVLISDDYAIQNICSLANIEFKPLFFKIKSVRKYFWKCKGCGEKYSEEIAVCPECGNVVKRYYMRQ
ncbi:MAG: hypothetical protein V3V41_06920 [Candidatus Heimdallarchaeota archaeon]